MIKILLLFNLFMLVYNMQNSSDANKNKKDLKRKREFLNKFAEYPVMTHNHRLRIPHHSAWMDYCDPYHCNDYDKEVCGLNRKNMVFQFFKSGCHLILHNQCSAYRGSLKFDYIALKHCKIYVMHLRTSCPTDCDDYEVEPICAMSSTKGNYVIFNSQCALEMANCKNKTSHVTEYEKVNMMICRDLLKWELKT